MGAHVNLELQRQLFARSERVKGIDFHPTEPWILTTLYSGHVYIWSYETQAIIKTFELTDVPVRAGRFVARKNWIVCGSDDFQLRVYNYNTSEKITSFEAHPDYIRAIVVHPTQPFVLTASDDMTIKLWDWDRSWKCVQVFEGHSHYVMGLAINPKDTNTFASACLDRTVKIWNLGSGTPNFTLEAHETKGVNHVDYYPQSDKPYLLTTSDDRTVKIWDYTTKALIATLEGHTSNVSFACYHPELPVIISGSEDGTVKIWHANTYRLEQSLAYGLERAWCVAYQRGKQGVAIGFDDGAVVVKMGREEPAVSMDGSGKIIWARHSEILTSVIKADKAVKDNQPVTLPSKDLGSTEIYPQTLLHSPNGRFVAVCGDGEYIVYTAIALRNQAFGAALDFAWAGREHDRDYAIRESPYSVKIFRNFKPKAGDGSVNVGFPAEGLAGGVLLGVKGQGGVGFFDWESGRLVRRIEVEPRNVYWSESGELVCLACEETFYVLRYSREQYLAALQAGTVEEDGVEEAFEVVCDINESVRTGQWIGDCFVYTNATNRLNYLVGDQTYTIAHFDQPHYVLGYLARDGRVYVCDKDVQVSSFALSVAVIEYQTLVLRGDLETANEMLPDIPAEQRNKIARFLEGQGYKAQALEVATDDEHRFELALVLGELGVAIELARKADVGHKWKTVGDAALSAWDLGLAEECFSRAGDWGSLLLLYSSAADGEGLRSLAAQATEAGLHNVAFTCLWQVGDVEACLQVLLATGRTAEAALFALTYRPSRAPGVVGRWKAGLEKSGKGKVAKGLGVPGEDEEMFPEWEEYLRLEKEGEGEADEGGGEGADLIDVGEGGEGHGKVPNGGAEGNGDKEEADDVLEEQAKDVAVEAEPDPDAATPEREAEA
ncbi:Coatomer subunit beta' [Teratosphaeriaceae sp. CCFEE 6253]|nr:Coatomer subunit beta' [Teratosphaeriaceae sp. CCFEE 6253]